MLSLKAEELAFLERAMFATGPFCSNEKAEQILLLGRELRAKAFTEDRPYSSGALDAMCVMIVNACERREGDLINIRHHFGDGPSIDQVISEFTSD